MYFIVRKNKYIDFPGKNFRQFLENKIKYDKLIEPEMKDWEIHLTTVFPEVRLKSFIELRGADGGPWSRVCALPAFWTGILYDEEILDQVSNIIKSWSYDQVKNFYEEVRINGFNSFTPDKENLKIFQKKLLICRQLDLKKET